MSIFTMIFLLFSPSLYFLWQDLKTRQPASKSRSPEPSFSQAPKERTRSEPSAAQPPQPRTEKGLYKGDILDELSQTTLHILFGVMSGGGKSTSMKSIIWKINQRDPDAQFFIVDPKTTDWLGLQLYPNTVTYLSGDVGEQLIQLKKVTEQVFNILDRRISTEQNSLKAGGQVGKKGHHIYLIIDEWYSLDDSLKKLPTKLKAEYELNAISLHINTIIAKGREHNVHVFLVSQTHLATETGISTAMRRSVALVGQGRLTEDGDGGYASIEGIINDSNVFKDSAKRSQLMKALREAIEVNQDNLPIILTTMGKPRIGLLPDLSDIHSYKIRR